MLKPNYSLILVFQIAVFEEISGKTRYFENIFWASIKILSPKILDFYENSCQNIEIFCTHKVHFRDHFTCSYDRYIYAGGRLLCAPSNPHPAIGGFPIEIETKIS